MIFPRFASTFLLLMVTCHLAATNAVAQAAPGNAQDHHALVQFVRSLEVSRQGGSLPSYDELLAVQHQSLQASATEISDALPGLLAIFQTNNQDAQIYAAALLLTIGERADSSKLLRPYLRPIGGLFSAADPRLQGTPILLISRMDPVPPEAAPMLIDFLSQGGRDPMSQASAVALLVHLAPNDGPTLNAVNSFLSKKLEPDVQVATLNALRGATVTDEYLIDRVVALLSNSDPAVRFTAAQVISTMGRSALLRAEPELRNIVRNPNESAETRAYAEQGLKTINRIQ
jgi:hypothetical protein